MTFRGARFLGTDAGMGASTVQLDVGDGVARITLDRPDAANTIGLQLAHDVRAASQQLAARDDVRAVLLMGAGARFCAGGDIKEFAATDELSAHLRAITEALHAAILDLVELEVPLIAAVQGSAAGAGLGLVLAADLVVAGESATFVMAYTAIGLTPDGSSSWFLPRVVGHRRAVELTLTNRVLDAREALDWGLVNRVVPDAQVASIARQQAEQLASGPTSALMAAKRLLDESWTHSLPDQLTAETDMLAAAGATADAAEGLAAFIAKRTPRFRGS